jgi:tetratricopeptide (TPR) repeat protein
MNKLKILFVVLTFNGGIFNNSMFLFAQQNQNEEIQQQEENPSNTETQNEVKQQTEMHEEWFKNAKIYPCALNNEKQFQIAVLDNGEAFLIFDHSYLKIPVKIKLNPEDIEVSCKNQILTLVSKNPLTSIRLKQMFSYKNQEIELIGTSKQDLNNDYIDSLFEYALKGNKKKILSIELKEIPFAYQYINSEKLSHFMSKILEKSESQDALIKINLLTSFGILSTKLIHYYHMNLSSPKEILEDYKNWVQAWEHIGLENYEDFILQYGETLLSINPTEGEEVLNFLKEKKSEYIPTYIVLGNYYWKIKQKEKAVDLYKKAIEIHQEKLKNNFMDEQNHASNIPDYIYERIKDQL